MLNELKFINSAVARKDYVQALQHVKIDKKTVRAYNGLIGLCCPIDLDLDITPRADQFLKAIQTCEDTIALHVTSKGKLSIKSGQFKALVECIDTEQFPEITPEGEFVKLTGNFLNAVKVLAPFISDDASRPWSRGILFKGQSAYATNNIILVESWLGFTFPLTVNIPRSAVNELLRINEEPEQIQVTSNRLTFHFSGGRWLCCQTLSVEWPDLQKVLNVASNPVPAPAGMVKALESLAPFTDKLERVFITADGKLQTSLTEDSEGASFELPTVTFQGCYNYKHLLTVLEVAKKIDFTQYPAPCLFYGDNIRGAIIGMRL